MRRTSPLRLPSLTALVALAACAQGSAATADELLAAVEAGITTEGLDRFASAIVRYERPSGSLGENAAIDSIVAGLREAGVPVEVHTFDTYASDPVSATVEIPGTGISFEAITMAYSGETDGLVARLVDLGTLRDLPGLEVGTGQRLALEGDPRWYGDDAAPDLQGAIAMVEGQPRNVPTAALALMGASGIIFVNPEERLNDLIVTSTWGTPSLQTYQRLPTIPTVQVAKSAGDALRERMTRGPTRVRITADVNTGRKPLRLVVARIEAPDADAPYVLLGGHIDGWYHAGTDEGAANAAMVELAKAFHQNRHLIRRGLVVAWWPGHSNARYAGSTWFADHFFEELRNRAVAYLNIDGVGQIDAKRFSLSSTAALRGLGREVVRVGVGESDVRGGTPGRNSDQSFNGIGLPLLQINHSRRGEDGGYWWWHTPDDTYDKIDFDILKTDAGLYAGALARLMADPMLPLDLVAEVEALGALIERRAEGSRGRFDLSEAMEHHATLLETVRAAQEALPGNEGADIDRALLSILRPLYRVTYDPVDPYHPDPGFSNGLLPGLAPVSILAEEDPGSPRYLFAETTLVRERNRLLEALDLATDEAMRLSARLR